MASTFSSALNLELQASGENSGTWGVITNNNLQKVESAIKGYVSVAIASTSDSLDTSDGSTTDEQSNAIIKLTGTADVTTTTAGVITSGLGEETPFGESFQNLITFSTGSPNLFIWSEVDDSQTVTWTDVEPGSTD